MAYELKKINGRARLDPAEFIAEGDAEYQRKIVKAADAVCRHLGTSPIVLLSGPSGSGKTTTAIKIEKELERRGIRCHSIALDNYFKDIGESSPKTPEGKPDLESPDGLDAPLLNLHFTMLSEGETIEVPKYDFSAQKRSAEPSKRLRLEKDEIAIFEGIHALNGIFTTVHPEAFKLYISARSNVVDDGEVVFKGTWMRFMRRVMRDSLFRGAPPHYTMELWANVRRGEKRYITPYKDTADLKFDSSLPYEVCVMKEKAYDLVCVVPRGTERYEELCSVAPALERFAGISEELVPADSLLREFIGGGIYEY